MGTDLILRPLAPEDSLEALTALLHRAYAPLAALGLNYTAVDQTVDMTRQRVHDGRCFVLAQGGDVVGTITVNGPFDPQRHAWARATPWYFRTDVAHIHQFAVEPAMRGQRLGERLFAACEDWARQQGHRAIALDTALPASHLRALYARWGFADVDEVQWDGKRYRSVVMVKALQPGQPPKVADAEHHCALVRTLWTCIQARDWAGMRALYADGAVTHWPCSGEWFLSADAIVKANAAYPEGWTVTLQSVDALADGGVHAVVRVDHPPGVFFGNARYRFTDGVPPSTGPRIAGVVEHWATAEPPLAWRTAEALGGAYRRDPV